MSYLNWNNSSTIKWRVLLAKNLLMCQPGLRAFVSTCLTCSFALHAYVLTYLACLCSNVPTCDTCLRVLLGKFWENVQCLLVPKLYPGFFVLLFRFHQFNATPLILLVKIILIRNCKSVKSDNAGGLMLVCRWLVVNALV